MNFSSDAMADFEGLLEVNRKICKQQMAEKASPTLPTNCAVLPLQNLSRQVAAAILTTLSFAFVEQQPLIALHIGVANHNLKLLIAHDRIAALRVELIHLRTDGVY